MAATYEQLVDYFIRQVPGAAALLGTGGKMTTPFQDYFNQFFLRVKDRQGAPDFADIDLDKVGATDLADAPAAAKAAGPEAEAAIVKSNTSNVPLEQGLLNTALPQLADDLKRDQDRRKLADEIAARNNTSNNNTQAQLARTQGGGFDGRAYLAANPDVAADYQKQLAAGTTTLSLDAFAEKHFLEFGQNEGRKPAYRQSGQLAQDYNNADTTRAANVKAAEDSFKTQTGALSTATTQLQNNLTGELQAKAAALDQQIKALNANLDTLDATQRKAILDQIAGLQANLEQSVATQRQALTDQLAALGTVATAEAAAKRDALTKEIAGLTAAQAPLAEARSRAAELQATAVNVGLQSTKDQLAAQQAKAGYVGGSTGRDAALARATIGARGQAAQAIGQANVQNASDTRDIGVRGATGERTISDALANANRDIGVLGANDNRSLTNSLATGTQGIANQGVNSNAALTNQTANSRAGIANQAANTTYTDTTTGAAQNRSILDSQAKGNYALTANLANDTQTADQQTAAAKATYYDNDYNRSLNANLLSQQQNNAQLTQNTQGDAYANSGLGRTQNSLSWWAAPTTTAPTPGAVAAQPDTTGNGIATAGAGLITTGANAANQWWNSNRTTTPKTSNTQNAGINPATGLPW